MTTAKNDREKYLREGSGAYPLTGTIPMADEYDEDEVEVVKEALQLRFSVDEVAADIIAKLILDCDGYVKMFYFDNYRENEFMPFDFGPRPSGASEATSIEIGGTLDFRMFISDKLNRGGKYDLLIQAIDDGKYEDSWEFFGDGTGFPSDSRRNFEETQESSESLNDLWNEAVREMEIVMDAFKGLLLRSYNERYKAFLESSADAAETD